MKQFNKEILVYNSIPFASVRGILFNYKMFNKLRNKFLEMRKLLFTLIAISFISCTQTQKAVYQQEETYTQEDRTLIIFYNENEISLPKLKRKVKSYGAEIIYEYKEMKGIAVRIFRGKSIEQGRKYFESIKGVTNVMKDGKVELH